MQTAEFAVTQEIDHKPAFNWWVKYVLKKRDRIIAGVRKRQTRYLTRSHKFGIELPKTVEEALTLDAKNGNILWADAISKKLKNICMRCQEWQYLVDRCNLQRNEECQSGIQSFTRWEVSTHMSPICAIPYGVQCQDERCQT